MARRATPGLKAPGIIRRWCAWVTRPLDERQARQGGWATALVVLAVAVVIVGVLGKALRGS